MTVSVWLLADLDGVVPAHVQDLLPVPEELAGCPLCVAAMKAHSHVSYLGCTTTMIKGQL